MKRTNLFLLDMKYILPFALVCFFVSSVSAQNYADLIRLSYNNSTLSELDGVNETDVGNFQADVLIPVPLTDKTSIIAGFTYENTRLGLQFSDQRTNLIMTRVNVGIKQKLSSQWSVTAVVLPKLASDFEDSASEDFQIGALALFEKKIASNKTIKFGSYVSSENYGTTITPMLGLYYQTRNKKFSVDAVLPIRGDVNYKLSNMWSVGANLLTSIKSYNLSEFNSDFYVQEESIRAALTSTLKFLDNALILRGKVGFDTTDYGLYAQGDTVGAQILTFQVSGDDRSRLNSEFDSGLFIGADLIFRVPL